MADLTTYTISYSEAVKGFPSYYSFTPDYMIGMNQHFYSFKGGNLWKHNTNELRNNYYGVQYNSMVRGVFNTSPLENKKFKTLSLESDSEWYAQLSTDMELTGYIDAAWMEKKENAFFSFIRTEGTLPAAASQYSLRSSIGIGVGQSVSIVGAETTVNFALSVEIGSLVSVGDMLYAAAPPYDTPVLSGKITAIEIDLPNSINRIKIDNTGYTAISVQDPYVMFIKDATAESQGLLGHYCIFELENSSTNQTELFTVGTEVFKSYP